MPGPIQGPGWSAQLDAPTPKPRSTSTTPPADDSTRPWRLPATCSRSTSHQPKDRPASGCVDHDDRLVVAVTGDGQWSNQIGRPDPATVLLAWQDSPGSGSRPGRHGDPAPQRTRHDGHRRNPGATRNRHAFWARTRVPAHPEPGLTRFRPPEMSTRSHSLRRPGGRRPYAEFSSELAGRTQVSPRSFVYSLVTGPARRDGVAPLTDRRRSRLSRC